MRNNGYIGYQLREMVRTGRIVSIFSDPENPDYFIAGYVLAANARTALVRSVTPYGRYDGFFGMRMAGIDEVQFDAVYADRLELMLRLNGETITDIPFTADEDHVALVLGEARRTHSAVTLWTADEVYSGFVEEVNDLRCVMTVLDVMGAPYQPTQMRLMDIELVSMGSEEEKMYEKLYEYNQNKNA